MQRIARTLVFILVLVVGYHIAVMVGRSMHAPLLERLVDLLSHGRGFTMASAAACLVTGELSLLACLIGGIILVTWPTDLVHLTFALVGGGLLGILLRSIIREHHAA